MNSKKIGFTLLIISVLILAVTLVLTMELNKTKEVCPVCGYAHFPSPVMPYAIWSAVILAVLLLSLSIYLIFFEKTGKEIMQTLETEKNKKIKDATFDILMKGLDTHEKKVLQEVKQNPGITQKTLTINTDLSKSKISLIISDFEKKGLVERKAKGKTYSIWLKKDI